MGSGYTTIDYRVEDHIATVKLNRPESGNALLTITSYREVQDAFERAGKDPEVRAVVLTGAGRHFSTGGDIVDMKMHVEQNVSVREDEVSPTGDMSIAIRNCPKPTVAMVNGAAAGAGAGAALACDFRVLSEDSKLIFAFVNVALTGDSCTMYFLARMVGCAKAAEWMMLGSVVGAEECKARGLATQVVPAGSLEEAAYTLAKRLAAGPTATYVLQKKVMNDLFFRDLERCRDLEAASMSAASDTEDFREAVTAFLEKRKPCFIGK